MILEVGLQLISNSVVEVAEKSMLSRWRAEYAAYKARNERRDKVFAAIGEGYDTLAEIVAFTGIPHATARRIVERFIAGKRIRAVKTKNPNYRIEFRYEII